MDITQITSLLSAGAPYSGAITALAELGIETEKILTPDQSQSYDQDYRSKLAEFVATVAAPDSADRADKLSAFVQRVCLRNGTPALAIPGEPCITIPVSHFLALGNDALLAERNAAIENALILGAKQQQAAVTPAAK